MATFDELARRYADEIAIAANRDKIGRAAGMLKEASDVARRSNVVAALKSVNTNLDSLVYTGTSDHLSEEDKDRITRSIAESLGVDPSRLRPAMKQASIDNAIVVVQDIENIIQTVKPK